MLSAALQVLGLAAVSAGLALIYLPVGIVAAGVSLFGVGLMLGVPRSRT